MSIVRDLTNKRFGRLVALSRTRSNKHGRAQWLCRCDCGAEKEIDGTALTSALTFSCGCLRNENAKKLRYIDGRSARPEYCVWHHFIDRCYNPTNDSYPDYGGRGIVVCERWRNDFNAFLADVGPRPSPRHSIDRIDNNGNYAPNNCRWATAKEQASNRRPRLRYRDVAARLTLA